MLFIFHYKLISVFPHFADEFYNFGDVTMTNYGNFLILLMLFMYSTYNYRQVDLNGIHKHTRGPRLKVTITFKTVTCQ